MDIKELCKKLDEALKRIAALEEENRLLKEKIAVLEKDSSTSSKPPSSDITKPKNKRRKPGERKRGGQKGHRGNARSLLPVEQVNDVIPHKLSSCPTCGTEHAESDASDEKVSRHQFFELPEQPVVVTEHRCHRTWCSSCKKYHYAALPEEVAKQDILGPRLKAQLGYMKGQFGASYSSLSEYSRDVLGLEVSRSLICNLIKKVSEALKPSYDELGEHIREQSKLHIDETGWKDEGISYWVWVFCNPMLAYFVIVNSRATQVLRDVLGKTFDGTIISDFYSAYVCYANPKQQFCLAHLIRDIKFLTTLPDEETQLFGEKLKSYFRRLFGLWHERASMDPKQFAEKANKLKRELGTYLTNAPVPNKGKAQNIKKRLVKHWDSLFLFLEHDSDIEPTNNEGEQTIRHLVIIRKLSQGSRSEWGREWNARIASVLATCKKQAISPYHFILQAVKAQEHGIVGPSLVF